MRSARTVFVKFAQPLLAAIVCVTVAAAAAGCGYTKVVGRGRSVEVSLTEYRLIPQHVQVSAGVLTIHVRNVGRLTHNLVIFQNGQPFTSTQPLFPGQSADLDVMLPPGTYSLASTVLSDQALGEYGTLTVTH